MESAGWGVRIVKRFLWFLTVLALGGLLAPHKVQAQFIGYTAPQTVNVALATNLACTGSSQTFTTGITPAFSNIGQTVHFVVLTAGGNLGGVQAFVQGSNDATGMNWVTISDTLTQVNGGIVGQGYYAVIRVVVKCGTGTFSLNYSGTSIPPTQAYASNLLQLVDKNVMIAQPANANLTTGNYFSPFGSSSGALVAVYAAGAGPVGSTLTVTCITQASTPNGVTFGPFTLAASTAVQSFPINAAVCPIFNVAYVSGGASANNVTVDYTFNPPGFPAASSAVIGAVTQGTSPWVDNVSQFGGNPVVTGTGASGAGIPRVTVSNDSSITVAPSLSSTILSGQQSVTNSAVALATNTLAHGICVTAFSTNAASIFLGPTGTTTTTGLELPAGASTCLAVSNSNAVFVVESVGGDKVSWVGN
jgi:hypothetical protein